MDKYLNYVNILLEKLIIILLKHININNYAIKLEKKIPFYDLIYFLNLIKLKILKIYIKTNLANSLAFI